MKTQGIIAATIFLVVAIVVFVVGISAISNAHEKAWNGVSSWSLPASETSYAMRERNELIKGSFLSLFGIALVSVSANRLLRLFAKS